MSLIVITEQKVSAMTLEEFWTIIDPVHQSVQGNMGYDYMEAKTRALEVKLEKLPPDEIASFRQHFGDCMARAYSWEIWSVAIVFDGGCDLNEFFGYFRINLISFGRQVFEGVMADPDSLGDLEIALAEPRYFSCRSDFDHAPFTVYKRKTRTGLEVKRTHPTQLSGTEVPLEQLNALYPKCAAWSPLRYI